MKFFYSKISLSHKSKVLGNVILKPIIPVKIIVNEKTVRYSALVDSGADFCIFDAEIGEALGLDVKSGEKEIFGGIQGKGGAEAFFHKVGLNIGGWGYNATVGFSYDIAKFGFGVLGQKGFFDIFTIKFDLLKEEIELKERK